MAGFLLGCGLMQYYVRNGIMLSKALLLLIAISISPLSNCFATTAGWDASSDSSIQGYRLYRADGTCLLHGYFSIVNTYGQVTSGTVTDPSTGGTYCHFLTAFNSAGESAPSNMVEYNYVITPPPQCPPISYCKTLRGRERKQCLACQ